MAVARARRRGCETRSASWASSAKTKTGELTVDVDGPDGTVVAVVGAESLPVVRVPGVDDMVLGAREEEVALCVVLDLCIGLNVPRQLCVARSALWKTGRRGEKVGTHG